MTDDDIPEIVIVPNGVGSHISRVNIYTYSDGAVKAITHEDGSDTFGTYSTIRYKEHGNLLEQNNGGNCGIFSNNIMSINNNVAYIEHTFIINTTRGTATWNGDSVSTETVDRELSRMIADYKSAGYDTASAISSANIKAALGL